jgi:hypothetical protein
LPEPATVEEAEATLAILKAAAAPFEALARAKPERLRPPDVLGGDSAKRFLDQQAQDATLAWRQAAAGEPLSCLSFADDGRTFRALCGDPRGQVIGDYPGAVQMAARKVAAFKAQQPLAAYDEAAKELRKMDLDIARALLKTRDLWFARVAKAEKIALAAGVSVRPQLKIRADLNQVFQASRNAKAEDLV